MALSYADDIIANEPTLRVPGTDRRNV